MIAIASASCVTPPVPVSPVPPVADRYQLAADPNPDVRMRATAELTNDPNPHAAELLLVMEQRDLDPRVRIAAAQAIAARHDPSLDPNLELAAAHDPDREVRAAAQVSHDKLWPWAKRPGVAAGLSVLCPGCGQLYLREPAEGAAMLGATTALVASGILLLRGHVVSGLGGPVDSSNVSIGLDLATAGQNLWFYSIFDAYRHARVLRDDAGYQFAITREALPDLISAPFRPRVLASPWVWAGVPLALAAGVTASYLINRGEFSGKPSFSDIRDLNVLGHRFSRGAGFAAGEGYFVTLFGSVGVGEESLFRGVIQTELEERFGTYGGLVTASAIFGAIHFLNFANDPKSGAVAVPIIATLGASLGLAYIRTGHRLETSVAMHFWYDFLLSSVAFAADPTHQPFVVQYASPL